MTGQEHPNYYSISLLQTMCALEYAARNRGNGLWWYDVFTDASDQLAPIPFAIDTASR